MLLRTRPLRKEKILVLVFALILLLLSCGFSFSEIKIFFSPKGDIAEEIIKQIDNAQESIDIAMHSFTSEPTAEEKKPREPFGVYRR